MSGSHPGDPVRRWIVGLVVATVVTAVFVYWLAGAGIVGADVANALASVHPMAVFAAAVIGASEMLLRTLRFRRALAYYGSPLSIRRAWFAQAVGFFGGGLTPFRVGEVGKAVFLRARDGVPLARGVAANLVERLFDFMAVTLLTLLAAVAIAGISSPYAPLAITLFLVVIALYAVLVILPAPLLREGGPLRVLGPRAAATLRGWLSPLLANPKTDHFRLTAEMSAWSGAIILVDLAVVYSLLLGLGIIVDVPHLAFAIGLGTLAGVASLLPGGIAVTEASYTYLLVQGGVPSSMALVAVLLARLLTFYPYMALGWFYGVREAAAPSGVRASTATRLMPSLRPRRRS